MAGIEDPPAAGVEDPPATAVEDQPLVAGTGAEATLAADGDAAAFWREFCQALLPRLGSHGLGAWPGAH